MRVQVRQTDGSALQGMLGRAYDRHMRSLQPLGREVAVTDKDGKYEIRYTTAEFSDAEKSSADLVLRAYRRDNTELAVTLVARSAKPVEVKFEGKPQQVFFNAPQEFTVEKLKQAMSSNVVILDLEDGYVW